MIQLDLIWVVLGCIVIGGAFVFLWFKSYNEGHRDGSKHDLTVLQQDTIGRLQAEKEAAEQYGCNRDCARRRTDNQLLKEKRLNVGCSEYKRELHAEKPTLTLCEQCHARAACKERDDRETCAGFISDEQAVADNNREAAESVLGTFETPKSAMDFTKQMHEHNNPHLNSTKKACEESIKHMPGVVVDGLSELTSWLGGILGEEHVGNLKDSGFTNEEIADIKWGPYGGALYGIHPNHLPMRIDENGIEFSNVFEGLPADFWEKVQGIGMTDEARKILEEGDGGEG